jgi:hypothetical protein
MKDVRRLWSKMIALVGDGRSKAGCCCLRSISCLAQNLKGARYSPLKFTHLFAPCFKEHFGKAYGELKLPLITDYAVYFGLGYRYNAVLSSKVTDLCSYLSRNSHDLVQNCHPSQSTIACSFYCLAPWSQSLTLHLIIIVTHTWRN